MDLLCFSLFPAFSVTLVDAGEVLMRSDLCRSNSSEPDCFECSFSDSFSSSLGLVTHQERDISECEHNSQTHLLFTTPVYNRQPIRRKLAKQKVVFKERRAKVDCINYPLYNLN